VAAYIRLDKAPECLGYCVQDHLMSVVLSLQNHCYHEHRRLQQLHNVTTNTLRGKSPQLTIA